DRSDESSSLNFELIAPTGISLSHSVTFRVDVDPFADEPDSTNNSYSTDALNFIEHNTPRVFYTSVECAPSGLGLPLSDYIQPASGDQFLRGIYPVNDGDSQFYREGPFPSI